MKRMLVLACEHLNFVASTNEFTHRLHGGVLLNQLIARTRSSATAVPTPGIALELRREIGGVGTCDDKE